MEISKLTTSVCTKCNGQVIERNGLDGMELLCLNCGFGQIPNIIPKVTKETMSDIHLSYIFNTYTPCGIRVYGAGVAVVEETTDRNSVTCSDCLAVA